MRNQLNLEKRLNPHRLSCLQPKKRKMCSLKEPLQ